MDQKTLNKEILDALFNLAQEKLGYSKDKFKMELISVRFAESSLKGCLVDGKLLKDEFKLFIANPLIRQIESSLKDGGQTPNDILGVWQEIYYDKEIEENIYVFYVAIPLRKEQMNDSM